MGKINVLSFEIANLIAAGEVVERPSSVLKELIENSIDSGATQIVAEIKRGGISLIRVSDNGCGMEKEDLPIALKRHATSKIQNKEDLETIMTLGFRGEALAAISSVSMLTIISKTKNAEVATMLTSEAGEIVDISEVGASDGTTVVVENLFYNVPARRKFLKKDSTEAMNVTALVERVALSRPDISIQLLIDGVEKFKTPGDNNLFNTVYSVFGKDFATKLIKVHGVANGITVHGFIGRSDNVRKNRNLQNVFINGRYVKSLTVMAGLEKAYTSYIAPEAFPTCVLFLEMNPSFVDVNVHPAKLEVKFEDERSVFETVYYTVKTALEEHEYRPDLTLTQKRNEKGGVGAFVPIGQDTKGQQISMRPQIQTASPQKDSYTRPSGEKVEYAKPRVDLDRPISFGSGSTKTQIQGESMTPKSSVELLERYRDAKPQPQVEKLTEKEATSTPTEKQALPEYKLIGEAFDCYVLVEYDGALLMIDKHAAHERVIFEDLKATQQKNGKTATQELLLPITVLLTPEEISVAQEFSADIKAVGFEYTVNGRALDVTAIPNAISPTSAEALLVEMLGEISEGRANPEISENIRREKALYQIACKSAIKGGRVYDKAIIEWLVTKLLQIPDITVCPHGRPVAYRLTKSELDRQFDRIK